MQTFDIVTIRLFLAVARAGSIGEAARREHIAASAVSRRISDLEAMLKVRLLRRLPRGVALTPEGEALARHGERILSDIRTLGQDLRAFAEGTGGEIWLSAVTSALNGHLPRVLARFRAENPDITLHLQELYTREAVEAVREGRVDLAVVADNAAVQGLCHLPFCEDPIWVVTPRDHPLLRDRPAGTPVPFAEACRYDVISIHQGGSIDELITAACAEAGVTLAPTMLVTRFGSLRRLVEEGLGIGFLRKSSVERHAETMDIAGAPLSDSWARRRLNVIHAGEPTLPPAARRLLAALRDAATVA
ncbi:transcriptional regulator, LysR family [Caenispirillum salinarum AK4]|uniref:Transcriptional regulator, LysR family n=1 Tax=Caenispirillum salinarum AK4 TaxID=1238182 RepID=K9H0N7_9PROT|nr:LysR substrate-binding domain-containing protein [Caenispirillum salinarum]EKV31835.1 transcriptional regulator, LysR family [Caenispirillum salinarum AK4]